MVNYRKPGLPADFDLPVAGGDLTRKPAKLAGYLERVQLAVSASELETANATAMPLLTETATASQPPAAPLHSKVAEKTISPATNQDESPVLRKEPLQPAQHYKVASRTGKRAQISLPPDIKQKLIEMSRLFSMQTNGQEINRSDIVIGLILALYEVKDQVTVGVLPTRGKWGAPTASQIGPALTLAFQEALSSNSAEDPFKKLGTAVNS